MPRENSRHRSHSRPRRFFANWIIAALVIVVVVVAIAVGWTFAQQRIDDNRDVATVQDCSAGYLTIDIWAPPEVQDSLTELIAAYQQDLPSDGGLCASFSISAQRSTAAAAALVHPHPYVPGVWIGTLPDIRKVEKQHPSLFVTKPAPVGNTAFHSVSLDLAHNDAASLDETTAAHTAEATQAAANVETYIQQHMLADTTSTPTAHIR